MSHGVRRGIVVFTGLVGLGGLLATARAEGQESDAVRQAFDGGMRAALAGRTDSALQLFTRAAEAARVSNQASLRTAAMRGQADVWLIRGCPDTAMRILRDAMTSAGPGDRSAADAMVRLLAARGDAAGARSTLVAAYADAGGTRRAITYESVAFLRGNAAIERAEGHESAALSTLNEAIAIADRLHQAHAADPRAAHAVGEVTRENAWLVYDVAQLRAQAKSPSIRSARESARLMVLLLGAWSVVDDLAASPSPTVRLGDRLVLRAEQCRANGTSCPVPPPTGGC